MNDEQGLFDILEKIQQWHNSKMAGQPFNKAQLRNLRLEIIKLAGLDTDKMIDLADEIDGCCFSIAQGDREILRILQENEIIDRCSTDLRALVENIGG